MSDSDDEFVLNVDQGSQIGGEDSVKDNKELAGEEPGDKKNSEGDAGNSRSSSATKDEPETEPEKQEEKKQDTVPKNEVASPTRREPSPSFKERAKKKPEPCSVFSLDVVAGFGICKHCGHTKASHGQKKTNKAAELLTNLRVKNSITAEDEGDYISKSSGPCGKFRLDVTASEFGTCKCGFKQKDHNQKEINKAQQALERLKSSNLDKYRDSAMSADGPCDNYRVDVAASEFATCLCGYKRDDHIKKEENKASKLLRNLKEKNKEKHEKEAKLAAGIVEEEVKGDEEVVEDLTKEEIKAETPSPVKAKKENCCVVS